MRLLRAGTWPWLLAHEVRLGWRGITAKSSLFVLGAGGLLWAFLHWPAWHFMGFLSLPLLEGGVMPIAGIVLWFALTLMLSAAVLLSVNALYDRGDLDLLMSAPLPTRAVFVVRGFGVALGSVALFAALATPFVHMGIARGQWGLLAAYPVLASFGLLASGIGFALTLALVRACGARRARVITQVVSAVLGAVLFLGFQMQNMLGRERGEDWTTSVGSLAASPWLSVDSVLWWPVRALFGDPLPFVAVVGAGVLLFALVVGATHRAFATGTQESVTATVRIRDDGAPVRFRHGLRDIVIVKELRLILRDPNLIAKTLLQTLYLVPMLFILGRTQGVTAVLAPAIIVMLAMMAGNLAWITIAGEEAPDLIGSAPVEREHVRWLKAVAAVLLPAALAVPFVAFYVVRAPLDALIMVVYLAFALFAAAVTQVWGGKPSAQRDLKQRGRENVMLNFAEVLSTLGIATACFLTINPSRYAFAGIGVGLIAPALAWTIRRAVRS